jgi:BlaI family transcriptional regulator, penicillinase repressor
MALKSCSVPILKAHGGGLQFYDTVHRIAFMTLVINWLAEGVTVGRRALRVAAGEMEILGMLWAEGPLTIREAHMRFKAYGKPVSYPTMQTRLNRLAEKGLAGRSEDRPARYRAAVSRDQVTLGHLRELVAKIGRGDVVPLVARLLSEQTLNEEQISQIRQLLEKAQQKSEAKATQRGKP